MRHLVLGSSGQIGGHLIKYLDKQGEQYLEFDISHDPFEDLRTPQHFLLENYIKNSDIVHFLAFEVGGAKFLERYQNSYEFIDINLRIMLNTFELLHKWNKPFIFASSQMAELPFSTYGNLKLIGEKITKDIGGLNVRFWNVYGYETNMQKSHVITDFILMAKKRGIIKMRTDGTESRQFLYADDACEALLILAKKYKELPKDKNYSITSFKWNTIGEVANIIDVLSSCNVKIGEKKDKTQMNAMNEPDPYIKKYWKPKTNLEDGITKIYNMYE